MNLKITWFSLFVFGALTFLPHYESAHSVPDELSKIFSYMDSNKDSFITKLGEVIAIKSISSSPVQRPTVFEMIQWVSNKLKSLGAIVTQEVTGQENHPSGAKLQIPPVILAQLGHDPNKKTILIYGHLDVQPGAVEDGWDTDPFIMTEKDGKLFGRGTTDDKGPVIAWLNVVEAYQKSGVEIPANLKFVFEAFEEVGSPDLERIIREQKDKHLKGVDATVISDSYWTSEKTPALGYGLRGLSYFMLEIQCAGMDLHSGIYGGSIHEAMADLIYLLDQLVDKNGDILIPGILDTVLPLTPEETSMYTNLDFDMDIFQKVNGIKSLRYPGDKVKTLMGIWRYPSLSIHGIEGGFSGPGQKTVIPQKVIGKFSIRLVPHQTPNEMKKIVTAYINKKWQERGSKNSMKVTLSGSGMPWISDPKHPNFIAAAEAVEMVWGIPPDLTRNGGSIPITLVLEDVTKKNVLMLPIGSSDDGAHSQNEKMNILNYINGGKVMAAYIWQIGNTKEKL